MGERIAKLERFFNVRKPKSLNAIQWLDKLYEMELQWEAENQKQFPL